MSDQSPLDLSNFQLVPDWLKENPKKQNFPKEERFRNKNDKKEVKRKKWSKGKNKNFNRRPNVLAIEWIEPFFTAGHWVPEMIELVGGKNLISKKGERSRKMLLDEIIKIDPELIILMPCGFNVERTIKEYKNILEKNSEWNSLRAVKEKKVFAVDANSFFSKPSLRTIIGIEILAKIIQPEIFNELKVPVKSYTKIT